MVGRKKKTKCTSRRSKTRRVGRNQRSKRYSRKKILKSRNRKYSKKKHTKRYSLKRGKNRGGGPGSVEREQQRLKKALSEQKREVAAKESRLMADKMLKQLEVKNKKKICDPIFHKYKFQSVLNYIKGLPTLGEAREIQLYPEFSEMTSEGSSKGVRRARADFVNAVVIFEEVIEAFKEKKLVIPNPGPLMKRKDGGYWTTALKKEFGQPYYVYDDDGARGNNKPFNEKLDDFKNRLVGAEWEEDEHFVIISHQDTMVKIWEKMTDSQTQPPTPPYNPQPCSLEFFDSNGDKHNATLKHLFDDFGPGVENREKRDYDITNLGLFCFQVSLDNIESKKTFLLVRHCYGCHNIGNDAEMTIKKGTRLSYGTFAACIENVSKKDDGSIIIPDIYHEAIKRMREKVNKVREDTLTKLPPLADETSQAPSAKWQWGCSPIFRAVLTCYNLLIAFQNPPPPAE
tara:strand:- start:728 stop:2098 length:1371 start_codon:yes stop_codon:yes gene_type:complete